MIIEIGSKEQQGARRRCIPVFDFARESNPLIRDDLVRRNADGH